MLMKIRIRTDNKMVDITWDTCKLEAKYGMQFHIHETKRIAEEII